MRTIIIFDPFLVCCLSLGLQLVGGGTLSFLNKNKEL